MPAIPTLVKGGRWSRAAAEEWAKKTGHKVEYISGPQDASATLVPSTVTEAEYNRLSTAFFSNVNEVLTGGETPQNAVLEVEKVAKGIVR